MKFSTSINFSTYLFYKIYKKKVWYITTEFLPFFLFYTSLYEISFFSKLLVLLKNRLVKYLACNCVMTETNDKDSQYEFWAFFLFFFVLLPLLCSFNEKVLSWYKKKCWSFFIFFGSLIFHKHTYIHKKAVWLWTPLCTSTLFFLFKQKDSKAFWNLFSKFKTKFFLQFLIKNFFVFLCRACKICVKLFWSSIE